MPAIRRAPAGPQRPRAEAASASTDVVLGAVALAEAGRLAADGRVRRGWAATLGWLGGAALIGALHHARPGRFPGWGATGGALAAGLSALLGATAAETGGAPPGAVRAIRWGGLAAYGAMAAAGRGGLEALVRAQSPAMAGTVALWLAAARAGHPRARPVLAAMAASAGAAGLRSLVPAALRGRAVDRDAVYHLAQIPGVVMLSRALRAPR